MHFRSKKIKQLSVPASTNVIKCNKPVNFPYFTIHGGKWGFGTGGLLFLLSSF